MATREIIELVCDFCGATGEGVETRRPLKGRVEVEACGRCWRKPSAELEKIEGAGRIVRQRRRKVQ